MSLNGRSDRMCPAEGVRLLDKGLTAAYEAAGKPEHWRNVAATGGHMETLEMRVAWQAFWRSICREMGCIFILEGGISYDCNYPKSGTAGI